MKKTIFVIIGILNILILNAQESSLQRNNEFIISGCPTYAGLVNNNFTDDPAKHVDKGIGINIGCSYHYYFNNMLAVSIGINFSSYHQMIYQKGLFITPNQTDRDSNKFDLWTNSDVEESNKLYYAEVPIMLHLMMGRTKKVHGFIDGGIVVASMIWGQYSKKGNIETIGKYSTSNPFWFETSQNNQYYQYLSIPYNIKRTGEEYFSKYNFSMKFSAGIAVAFNDKYSLMVAPTVTKGFSDITSKNHRDKDYISVTGVKSSYSPLKSFAVGLNIGLRIEI